jgi:phenylacetate-CoA ligase
MNATSTTAAVKTALPLYHYATDWPAFYAKYPPPDVFLDTVFRWPAERVRALQNERFKEVVEVGWDNPFYQKLWGNAGLKRGDIRGLDDISKLPIFNSDDIKSDQQEYAPFGSMPGFSSLRSALTTTPIKLQTSGGTTGKPRATLHGPVEWEMGALNTARSLYLLGARPGDVMQIPSTCSLANLGWGFYKACHDYLGVLPVTTGSGVVTPSRRQLEIAFDYGVNLWVSFPEYLIRLAKTCREELGRDVRELNTKFILTFLGPDVEGTLRQELESLWGCPVYDNYGTNELGEGAFECPHKSGLHLMEDLDYFEILDTETNQPVQPGEIGNLVVTVFHRRLQPLIRFNLRDLGRLVSTDTCACGSNFRRIDHFLGRSDSMVKIRGLNLYPMACLGAVKSDPRTTGEWLCEALVVDRDGTPREELVIHVEYRKDADGNLAGLTGHLEQRLKSDLGLSVQVKLVPEGNLDQLASLGEGKAKRLIDRRPAYRAKA